MSVEAYEVRKRSDKRGVNRISDALPFGGLWYGGSNAISNAIDYAKTAASKFQAAAEAMPSDTIYLLSDSGLQ
jgi:hypothetical protein